MKSLILICIFIFFQLSCAPVKRTTVIPLPIIMIPDARDESKPKQYVMLKLPYGIIIQNGTSIETKASYHFFDRDKKIIMKTLDVNKLISKLKNIPDKSKIDMISKCTIGFYNEYGANIDNYYKKLKNIFKQKKFNFIYSEKNDKRHASFCYCETGFMILEKYVSIDHLLPYVDKFKKK